MNSEKMKRLIDKFWRRGPSPLTKKEAHTYEHLQTCPKKDLLEYVGTIFDPIVERRLKIKD